MDSDEGSANEKKHFDWANLDATLRKIHGEVESEEMESEEESEETTEHPNRTPSPINAALIGLADRAKQNRAETLSKQKRLAQEAGRPLPKRNSNEDYVRRRVSRYTGLALGARRGRSQALLDQASCAEQARKDLRIRVNIETILYETENRFADLEQGEDLQSIGEVEELDERIQEIETPFKQLLKRRVKYQYQVIEDIEQRIIKSQCSQYGRSAGTPPEHIPRQGEPITPEKLKESFSTLSRQLKDYKEDLKKKLKLSYYDFNESEPREQWLLINNNWRPARRDWLPSECHIKDKNRRLLMCDQMEKPSRMLYFKEDEDGKTWILRSDIKTGHSWSRRRKEELKCDPYAYKPVFRRNPSDECIIRDHNGEHAQLYSYNRKRLYIVDGNRVDNNNKKLGKCQAQGASLLQLLEVFCEMIENCLKKGQQTEIEKLNLFKRVKESVEVMIGEARHLQKKIVEFEREMKNAVNPKLSKPMDKTVTSLFEDHITNEKTQEECQPKNLFKFSDAVIEPVPIPWERDKNRVPYPNDTDDEVEIRRNRYDEEEYRQKVR